MLCLNTLPEGAEVVLTAFVAWACGGGCSLLLSIVLLPSGEQAVVLEEVQS